jgi:predicted RNA-binding Zn ribbon-like protein
MATPADPTRPFRYVGGDLSLDLVNTVDWLATGQQHERLTDYAALLRWAEGASVVDTALTSRLRRRARGQPVIAVAACREALALRDTIRRCGTALVAGGEPDPEALGKLNRKVAEAFVRRALTPASDGRLMWSWVGREPDLRIPLWLAALSAAELFSSGETRKLRICAGDECGWMYVDRSRTGLRRWCAMDMCGGQEKARRHYARVRGGVR